MTPSAGVPPGADEELGPPQQLRKLAVLELVRNLHHELWMRRLEIIQCSCNERGKEAHVEADGAPPTGDPALPDSRM